MTDTRLFLQLAIPELVDALIFPTVSFVCTREDASGLTSHPFFPRLFRRKPRSNDYMHEERPLDERDQHLQLLSNTAPRTWGTDACISPGLDLDRDHVLAAVLDEHCQTNQRNGSGKRCFDSSPATCLPGVEKNRGSWRLGNLGTNRAPGLPAYLPLSLSTLRLSS